MNTPEAKLIKLPEVKRIVGLGKTSIYSLMKKGKFPQQVPMGFVDVPSGLTSRSTSGKNLQITGFQQ